MQERLTSRLVDNPAGFVALIDGSERALRALEPALALADWYGRPCAVLEVTAGDDDHDTDNAVTMQLQGTRFESRPIGRVAKGDLESEVFGLMAQGQILVSAAFGVWRSDGRLHGALNGLVEHNAPAIIGVGPNVADEWDPAQLPGPILVCVDGTEHANHLVDKLEPFLVPARAKVMVLHVDLPAEYLRLGATPAGHIGVDVARQVAVQIHERFGMPVDHRSVCEDSAAAGIAITASRLQSPLVITHSWHRPRPGRANVSSISLTSVAHSTCPVVILSDQSDQSEQSDLSSL